MWPLCGSQKQLPKRIACILTLRAQEGGGTNSIVYAEDSTGTKQDTHICQPDQTQNNGKQQLSWGIGAETPTTDTQSQSLWGSLVLQVEQAHLASGQLHMRPLHRQVFPDTLVFPEELASGLPGLRIETHPVGALPTLCQIHALLSWSLDTSSPVLETVLVT